MQHSLFSHFKMWQLHSITQLLELNCFTEEVCSGVVTCYTSIVIFFHDSVLCNSVSCCGA